MCIFSSGPHFLQIGPRVFAQAQLQSVSLDCPGDGIRLRGKLIADRRPDEVGAVGVERKRFRDRLCVGGSFAAVAGGTGNISIDRCWGG